VENLSEHDEIVENCFDPQSQGEAHTLLSEGIASRCRDEDKLPVRFVRKRWNLL